MNVHVTKPVPIVFKQVVDAYQKVRRGGKAAGIDEESWEEFDKKLAEKLPNYRSKQYKAKHEITDEMREDIRQFLVERKD